MREFLDQHFRNLREVAGMLSDILEKRKVERGWNGVMAAVDGGAIVRKYAGFDIIYFRALGVVKAGRTSYHPSRFPEIRFRLNDIGNSSRWAGILRVKEEARTVIEVRERFSPDIMLLDGSILPHPKLKTERFKEDYEEMMGLFRKMWKGPVVGIVKDPTSSRLVRRMTGLEFRDSAVLDKFLGPDERTETLEAKGIKYFYMKIGNDFPIKVEFTEGDADEIASAIASTAVGYQNLPMALIEADYAVKIREKEIDAIERRYLPDPRFKRRRDRA